MKKLLILLLTLLLCACGGSKKLTWEDVSEAYTAIEQNVISKAEALEEIYKEDYTKLTDYMRDHYGDVIYDKKSDGKSYIDLYAKAIELRFIASMNNSVYANELTKLADDIIDLIKASLDSEEAVEEVKARILDKVADVYTWEDKVWTQLEKRSYLEYDSVAKQYDFIDDNFRVDMIPNAEVSEADLEQLKKVIIDGYEKINVGINSSNHETAKEVYTAAKRLWWYTKYISSENADKVYYFADKTMDFVKRQYKGYNEEYKTEYDYTEEITAAKKYTQSVFNEIVILLRQATMA